MQKLYLEPVNAQAELMDDAGMTSFDQRKYMSEYRRRMEATIKRRWMTVSTTATS